MGSALVYESKRYMYTNSFPTSVNSSTEDCNEGTGHQLISLAENKNPASQSRLTSSSPSRCCWSSGNTPSTLPPVCSIKELVEWRLRLRAQQKAKNK